MADERLENKVAVVTGGGSGIGRSICNHFARAGADVMILDINDEAAAETREAIENAGGKASAYHCDVADRASVAEALQAVLQNASTLDILVNNAGVSHVGNVESTTPEDMDRLYEINVKGVYHCTQAAIGRMVEQGGGAILNLASILSRLGVEDRFAYSMTKGAVLAMTLSVARDYIARNVRCNCLCPARVHTPFVDDYLRQNYAGQEQEMYRKLADFQPIGRMGTPQEVANLALFLCSAEAAFITGSAYDIDGGVMNLR